MSIKQGIRRNFARRAASYDRYAQVQRFMAGELLSMCGVAVRVARSILEIGCGTGYLTARLRQSNPAARIVAMDLDHALVARAKARQEGNLKADWVVADGENPGVLAFGSFDLIISNSTFQWFSHPEESVRAYVPLLEPGGCLAIATLGPGTFQELAQSFQRAAAAGSPAALPRIAAARFLGERQWLALLHQAGFGHMQHRRRNLVLNFPSVWEFLKSLQATGATNPEPQPFSPRLLRALISAYQAGFSHPGGIPVTYDLIWIVARP